MYDDRARLASLWEQELATFRRLHPRSGELAERARAHLPNLDPPLTHHNAQLVVAREYGFAGWQELTAEVSKRFGKSLDWAVAEAARAIHNDDIERLKDLLAEHPALIQARRTRDETDAAFRVARKWNRPRWTLDVRADSQRDPDNGQMQWFEGVAVEVRGNLSLLDGGAGSASAQGESQRLLAADAAVENVHRELKQELARQWVSLPLREQQLATLDELVDASDRMRKVGEEQLFYLMSRGIDEETATSMVVNGFIEPLVKELPMEYAIEMNRLIQLQMEGSVG